MKVLGIMGSPRREGNTDVLLDKALDGARDSGVEAEKLIINDLEITPCQEDEYDNVDEGGLSVVGDDMHFIFKEIKEADAVILASPIFFGSLSGQTKIMIDRFQCVWLAKNIFNKQIFTKEKPGAFLCVEATEREDFFDNAKSIVRHFFATIGIKYEAELFCPGIDKKGSILSHPDCLEKAYELGKKIAII